MESKRLLSIGSVLENKRGKKCAFFGFYFVFQLICVFTIFETNNNNHNYNISTQELFINSFLYCLEIKLKKKKTKQNNANQNDRNNKKMKNLCRNKMTEIIQNTQYQRQYES